MSFDRSSFMARIKGRNTSPERALRSALWSRGLRYRLHARTPAGRPDIVFPGPRVAIFVDGCFWHGCPEHYVRPRSNEPFWSGKLRENVNRDRHQTAKLESLGWLVVRVWEHRVFDDLPAVLGEVEGAVRGRSPQPTLAWRVVRVEDIDVDSTEERRFMEDLRDPGRREVRVQTRSTKKWTVPTQPLMIAAGKSRSSIRTKARKPSERE